MSLISRLHGAQCTPLRQQLRRVDGVRGVFTLKPLQRGELILSLPLRHCYITHLYQPHVSHSQLDNTRAETAARELRRWNRGVTLLPEVWTWLERFSCDAPSERVMLTSSVSMEAESTSVASSPAIASLTLSPVEAAVATAVALRHFYGRALRLSRSTRASRGIGAPTTELGDRFVDNLPLDLYMTRGVEALYSDAAASAEAHLCLEQLAQNLRDAVLTHANNEEYRFLDEYPSLFDALLLVSLYVVRSRVLTVPLLGRRATKKEEGTCGVLAPLLDGLNHAAAADATAAVVVSLQRQRLVVRATRNLRRGEEVTLDYRAARPMTASAAAPLYEVPMEEDWSSRYLMTETL